MNTVYFFVCMSKHVEFRGQPQVLLPSLQLPRILLQDLALTGREPRELPVGFLYAGITSGGTILAFSGGFPVCKASTSMIELYPQPQAHFKK